MRIGARRKRTRTVRAFNHDLHPGCRRAIWREIVPPILVVWTRATAPVANSREAAKIHAIVGRIVEPPGKAMQMILHVTGACQARG